MRPYAPAGVFDIKNGITPAIDRNRVDPWESTAWAR